MSCVFITQFSINDLLLACYNVPFLPYAQEVSVRLGFQSCMFVSHSAHSDQGPSSGPGSPPYRDFPDMFQLVHSEAHTESKQLVGILLECFLLFQMQTGAMAIWANDRILFSAMNSFFSIC